jgi:cyclohexanecarboxyl-CoA dehydrogenase
MNAGFLFSADHEQYREKVRSFANDRLSPNSRRWDAENVIPWDAVAAMAEEGLLGVIAPKDVGGASRDYLSLGITIEELAKADVSCAIICWLEATIGTLMPGWGEETLRDVHAGRKLIALATSEEHAGSNVANIKTVAVADGGDVVINGEKIHVSLVPGAAVLGVSARIETGTGRPEIRMFRVPSDASGVTCEPMEQLGARAHQLGRITFRDVRVPADAVLGKGQSGGRVLNERFNVSRCLSPLAAIGAAQATLDMTMEFAKNRKVFGRPIATNQSISFPLVEHYTRLEAARLLAYKALWMNQNGQSAQADTAMAKWFGVTTSIQAITDCLQIHGANAYLVDYPFEQRLRDVHAFNFTGGTVNVMKILLVRSLLGREFTGLDS